MAEKEDRLYRMRHSAAHIMAEAVLEMMPEAKFAIGPPIENGFYYDFLLPRALTPDDLPDSVAAFKSPAEVAELMRAAGLSALAPHPLMFGTVVIHQGLKQLPPAPTKPVGRSAGTVAPR